MAKPSEEDCYYLTSGFSPCDEEASCEKGYNEVARIIAVITEEARPILKYERVRLSLPTRRLSARRFAPSRFSLVVSVKDPKLREKIFRRQVYGADGHSIKDVPVTVQELFARVISVRCYGFSFFHG